MIFQITEQGGKVVASLDTGKDESLLKLISVYGDPQVALDQMVERLRQELQESDVALARATMQSAIQQAETDAREAFKTAWPSKEERILAGEIAVDGTPIS